jgi:hypothetical protein
MIINNPENLLEGFGSFFTTHTTSTIGLTFTGLHNGRDLGRDVMGRDPGRGKGSVRGRGQHWPMIDPN